MTNDHGKKVNLKSCSYMRSLLYPMVCSLSWYIRHWGIWGPSCVTNSCFIFLPHLPKEWRSRSHEYDFDYAHLSRRCAPVCSQINDMLSFPKIDSYIIICMSQGHYQLSPEYVILTKPCTLLSWIWKASRPMRNIETFPSKLMYLYLSLHCMVKRKVLLWYW